MIRQKDTIANDRRSKAPYNFIPLPEKVMTVNSEELTCHDQYVERKHTGYIALRITAETPLYIRSAGEAAETSNQENQGPNEQFFHHGQLNFPVIPGSSLRGMIRSLVEIISFSKMQWVTDEALIYRAVGDTSSLGVQYRKRMSGSQGQIHGGYLERRGPDWVIRPARKIHGESMVQVDYHTTHNWTGKRKPGHYSKKDLIEVYVKPERKGTGTLTCINASSSDAIRRKEYNPCPDGFTAGILIKSGHLGNKHKHHVIFEPDRTADCISIPQDLWKLYEKDRDMTRSDQTSTRKLKQEKDPLFYLVHSKAKTKDNPDGLVFFGPTRMFRLPYGQKITDLIPEQLRNSRDRDLAETLFGTVEDDETIIRGRVFFEDAMWDGNGGDPLGDPFVPKILSSPKPTSFQHYLVQTDDHVRRIHNWDTPSLKRKHSQTNRQGNADSFNNVIRGYKRYWHKPNTSIETVEAENIRHESVRRGQSKQHTIIRPVKSHTNFIGKVRFENLSNLELGALLSTLELPASKRHHLGMGKPYGMGSVSIVAALVLTNRTGEHNRYTRMFGNDGQFDLGELSATQNKEVGEKAKREFCKAIVKHQDYKGAINNLWDIPRLQTLALMLEWDNPPISKDTVYTPLETQAWRDRHVLPTPENVVRPRDASKAAGTGTKVKNAVLEELVVGEVHAGIVSKLVKFGAFVNIDGTDGLIHISELSWSKINHPSEVLEVGQLVQVKVISVEKARKRVSFSLRQMQSNPWDTLAERYKEGDRVRVVITRIKDFGAFARLIGEPVEGLIHVSEISHEHVDRVAQVVTVGEEYEVKIIRVDTQRRRMGLSIKQAT